MEERRLNSDNLNERVRILNPLVLIRTLGLKPKTLTKLLKKLVDSQVFDPREVGFS